MKCQLKLFDHGFVAQNTKKVREESDSIGNDAEVEGEPLSQTSCSGNTDDTVNIDDADNNSESDPSGPSRGTLSTITRTKTTTMPQPSSPSSREVSGPADRSSLKGSCSHHFLKLGAPVKLALSLYQPFDDTTCKAS